MITPAAATRANLRLCVTCRHVLRYTHPRRIRNEPPRITYKCTLTNHTVTSCQTSCSLYEPAQQPIHLPPIRPNPHSLIP